MYGFYTKAYKRFTPTVFIGSDALKFTRKAKYLGFTINDSKCDDSDMLRQMRSLYAKSNKTITESVRPEVRGTTDLCGGAYPPSKTSPSYALTTLIIFFLLRTDGERQIVPF